MPEVALVAQVAFKNLMTHGSAIRTAYRTSLRSSSLWEPRHPPVRIWFLWFGLIRLLLDLVLLGCTSYPRTTAATEGLVELIGLALMILPQVHLRKPCYDFSFL